VALGRAYLLPDLTAATRRDHAPHDAATARTGARRSLLSVIIYPIAAALAFIAPVAALIAFIALPLYFIATLLYPRRPPSTA
jgi:hypothetical protein